MIELAQAVKVHLKDSHFRDGTALIDIALHRPDVASDISVIARSHTMQPFSILDLRRQSNDSLSIEAQSQERLAMASRMADMFQARRSAQRLPVQCLETLSPVRIIAGPDLRA